MGLERQDLLGGGLRVVDADAGQHRAHVRDVGLADRDEFGIVGQIVIAVRQAQTGLREPGDVLRGILGILVDVETHRRAHAELGQLRERRRQLGLVVDRIDRGQFVLERFGALGFECGFVHERVVEIAHFLLIAAVGLVGLVGRFLDDGTQVLLGLVRQRREGAVVGFVGRNLGRVQPVSVDVAEQVVLWSDALVEIGGVDAGGQRLGRGCGGFVGGCGVVVLAAAGHETERAQRAESQSFHVNPIEIGR